MELNEALDKIRKNELDSMSRDELETVAAVLWENGKEAEAKAVVRVLNTKPAENKSAAAAEPQITTEQFDKNVATLEAFSQTYNINNDPELAQQIANMQIVADDNDEPLKGEDNQPTVVGQEVVDVAKLIVQNKNVENPQEIKSADEYNEKVNAEIVALIKSMKASEKTMHDKEVDTSKGYNMHAMSIGAALTAHIETIKERAQELSEKYKESKSHYLDRVREQAGTLDAKLTKKLGKWYTAPRDTVKAMIKNGTWKEAVAGGVLGGVSMFATGAVAVGASTVGLALYSTYIGYRRCAPFIKKMFADKKATEQAGQKFSYKQYYKEHKNDARKAALYAAAGVAGIVGGLTAGYTAYLSAADAAAQSAAISSTWLTSATGVTRMASTWGATNVADLSVALDFKRPAEERKEAWKHIGTNTAVMGGIMAGGALISGYTHDANAAEPAPDNGNPASDNGNPASDNGTPAPDNGTPAPENGTPAPDNGTPAPADGDTQDPAKGDVVTTYSVEPAGDREMAIYTRNLKLVPGHEEMIKNINDGLIKIPDGMSPEEAINIARVQALNYGDKSLLIAMKDCDGVEIDMSKRLFDLHNNSWTKLDGVHRLGDIKDFVGDNCHHGTIKSVDCDKVKIISQDNCHPKVYNNDHVVTQEPATQEPAAQQAQETKPAMRPLDKMPDHYNSPNEMITPDPAKANIRVDVVPQNNAGHPGHYNNEQEYYQDQSGSRPVKSTSGKTFTVKGSYVRD